MTATAIKRQTLTPAEIRELPAVGTDENNCDGAPTGIGTPLAKTHPSTASHH